VLFQYGLLAAVGDGVEVEIKTLPGESPISANLTFDLRSSCTV